MPVNDIDSARTALRAGSPEELLGLAECGWLDAKGGIYRLDDPAGAEELAKDVAAFANAKTGGLLLVGFGTRKEYDSEILDRVRPVPRGLVDLDRHRKLIRERVIPSPRDVTVEWVERYWPGVTSGLFLEALNRGQSVMEQMRTEGTPVRAIISILIPAEEVVFSLYEGPSATAVRQVNDRAGIPVSRIVEAISVIEDHKAR